MVGIYVNVAHDFISYEKYVLKYYILLCFVERGYFSLVFNNQQ